MTQPTPTPAYMPLMKLSLTTMTLQTLLVLKLRVL